MAWTEADDPDYLAQPVTRPHLIRLHASAVDCRCLPALISIPDEDGDLYVACRVHEPGVARTRRGVGHP